jgi:hypothetical protein
MGCISRLDIAALIKQYDLQYFVETGVGQAISLVHMVNFFPMRAYYSCDYDEVIVRAAQWSLQKAPDVHIVHARSKEFLETLLSWLPQQPILFWLDAHFAAWANSDDRRLYLPLADELSVIRRLRPEGRDVIVMDDAAIYVDGPFQIPLDPGMRPTCPEERDIDFVHETLDGTHHIKVLYSDGGYVLATPRN